MTIVLGEADPDRAETPTAPNRIHESVVQRNIHHVDNIVVIIIIQRVFEVFLSFLDAVT